MSKQPDLLLLRDKLRAFAEARDWEQFHSPKNLSMALMVEVAELMEHFQWLSETQSANLAAKDKLAVADELADILLYLVRLSDKLDVDLLKAAQLKLEKNATKYPAEQVRGSAKTLSARFERPAAVARALHSDQSIGLPPLRAWRNTGSVSQWCASA